jgi:hypothetical protein
MLPSRRAVRTNLLTTPFQILREHDEGSITPKHVHHASIIGSWTADIARLQQATSAAATTLLKTMTDPNAPASVRVRAADSIFSHAAKAIEIEDIDARVTALEQTAAIPRRR